MNTEKHYEEEDEDDDEDDGDMSKYKLDSDEVSLLNDRVLMR